MELKLKLKKGDHVPQKLALILLLGFVFSLACTQGDAWADSMVCPKGVASTGDHQSEILAKCGEPQFRKVISTGDNNSVVEEQWGYFISKRRVFIFENGFLSTIVY